MGHDREERSLAIERDRPGCTLDYIEGEFDAPVAGEAEAGKALPAGKGAADRISELALVADEAGLLLEPRYWRYDDWPAAGFSGGTTVFGRQP